MKRICWIICILELLVLSRSVCAAHISIEEQTFLIYRRYYFIKRLDKTIRLLATMYQHTNDKKITVKELCPQHECTHIKHKAVIRSINCILQTGSLKPLFLVWDAFRSYKFLYDDLFVDDFSKEVFIVVRNSINRILKTQPDVAFKHSCMHHSLDAYKLDELLNDIYEMSQYLAVHISQGYGESYCNRLIDIDDIHFSVNTDQVAFRFYCIKRVQKAVDIVLNLYISDHIHHNQYVQKILGQRTFKQLWNEVKQYHFIENEQFVREFLVCTLILLHDHQNNMRTEVSTLYEQIEKMPIEELLQAIDTVTSNINQAYHDYKKSGLSFSEWIKQYWWVGTLAVLSCVIKIIQHYHTSN